jgi:hypothetical protein
MADKKKDDLEDDLENDSENGLESTDSEDEKPEEASDDVADDADKADAGEDDADGEGDKKAEGAEDADEASDDADADEDEEVEDKKKASDKKKADKKPTSRKKSAHRETDKESRSASRTTSRKRAKKRKKNAGKKFTRTALIVCVIIALVAGILLDHFGLYGLFHNSSALADTTTVTEDQLDTVMGTYFYDGQAYDITVQDVIEASSTLDSAKNDDGTYDVPAVDDALSYARTEILNKEVEKEGITVSDDEVDAYAEQYLGTSDYDTIASNWGLDAETAKETIKQSCAISKLRDEKVGTFDATLPSEPTEAAEGEEDTPTAEYGAYIVELLGDEWDTENETWARTDGPYYEALSGETFTSTSATYNQAETAYYVAYSEYGEAYSAQQTEWQDYVNSLLSNASIELYTLGV